MGWLDKIFPPARGGQRVNLPSLDVRDLKLPAVFGAGGGGGSGEIPNAALVYGVGAAILFTFALYSLFTGAWLTAFLLLFPAGALLGFALHYIRNPS